MSAQHTFDLSQMSIDDLCILLLLTGRSDDPSDQAYCRACRDELAKRRPEQRPPAVPRIDGAEDGS